VRYHIYKVNSSQSGINLCGPADRIGGGASETKSTNNVAHHLVLIIFTATGNSVQFNAYNCHLGCHCVHLIYLLSGRPLEATDILSDAA
jgi:hypothetical protein